VDVICVFACGGDRGWEPVMGDQSWYSVVLSDRAVKVSDDSLYVTFIGLISLRKAAAPVTGWPRQPTAKP
jgi:hypothetical protein